MKTTITLALLSLALYCASAAHADTFGTGGNQFTIDFVTIGNPGNPADTTGRPNPAGSVPHVYRMGQYEVSRDMVEKASIEGGLGLTLEPMDFVTGGPRPDMPATGVSWNEAARFVNWLNTSEGFSAAYKFATQPGDVDYNSNENILLWDSADAGYNVGNRFRNSLAHYFLPSVHEWYKAAYYDASAGVYYDYPTGSDSTPDGIDFAGDTSFDAVFEDAWPDAVFFDGGSNPQPNDITDVGVLSPYGTAGQGGNVLEWEETEHDLVNDNGSSGRGVCGGNWSSDSKYLLSSLRVGSLPADGFMFIGFRVASIPEPSTLLLGFWFAWGLLRSRRR